MMNMKVKTMKINKDLLIKKHYTERLYAAFPHHFTCDVMEYEASEVILRQGEELHYLYFLMRGKVKIYSTSREGKRLIVAFNRPIQLFGDIEFLQGTPIINTVEALGSVQLLRFSVAEARRLQRETTFNDYLLDVISRKFYTKSEVLSFHLLNEATIRFASYLLSVSHNDEGQFVARVVKRSELAEIAEFINITTRHQNRLIQQFVAQHIVTRIPEGIVIESPELLQQKAAHNVYELQ